MGNGIVNVKILNVFFYTYVHTLNHSHVLMRIIVIAFLKKFILFGVTGRYPLTNLSPHT